jgi:hypothetical protein
MARPQTAISPFTVAQAEDLYLWIFGTSDDMEELTLVIIGPSENGRSFSYDFRDLRK